jgi:hypothetical protein
MAPDERIVPARVTKHSSEPRSPFLTVETASSKADISLIDAPEPRQRL